MVHDMASSCVRRKEDVDIELWYLSTSATTRRGCDVSYESAWEVTNIKDSLPKAVNLNEGTY